MVLRPTLPKRGLSSAVLLIALPPLLLLLYGALSLVLFYGNDVYRSFVSAFDEQTPWLVHLFPVLRRIPRALDHRNSSMTVGYFYHLYFTALVIFLLSGVTHIIAFRSIQRALLTTLRSDVRQRKMFDDANDAITKITLAIACAILLLLVVSQGWLWSEQIRAWSYMWSSGFFPFFELPLFFGALPAGILVGIQRLIVVASADSNSLPWGVDAVREEAALNASRKHSDQR